MEDRNSVSIEELVIPELGKAFCESRITDRVVEDHFIHPYPKLVPGFRVVDACEEMLKQYYRQYGDNTIRISRLSGDFAQGLTVGDNLCISGRFNRVSAEDYQASFEGTVGDGRRFSLTFDHGLGGYDFTLGQEASSQKFESCFTRDKIQKVLIHGPSILDLDEILYCEACKDAFIAQGTKPVSANDFIVGDDNKKCLNPAGFMEAVGQLGSFVVRKDVLHENEEVRIKADAMLVFDGQFHVSMHDFDHELLKKGSVYLTVRSCLQDRNRAYGKVFFDNYNPVMDFAFGYRAIPKGVLERKGMLNN